MRMVLEAEAERPLGCRRGSAAPIACASVAEVVRRPWRAPVSGANTVTAAHGERQADHRCGLDRRTAPRAPAGRAARRAGPGWWAERRGRRGCRWAPSAHRAKRSEPLSISIDSICSTKSGLPSAATTIRSCTSPAMPASPSSPLDDPRRVRIGQRLEDDPRRVGSVAHSACVSSRSWRERAAAAGATAPRPARPGARSARGTSARPSGCRR